MVEGLVIAAGLSSRMGANKLLMDLAGQPVIRRSVMTLVPFCESITVVTGHSPGLITSCLSGMPRLKFVQNPLYMEGMFSSAMAGFSHIDADRCVFLPGDCPLAGPGVVEKLLLQEGDILVPRHEGKSGHPVVFSRKAIEILRSNLEFTTLRHFIEASGPVYVDVDCPGILMDIDTAEDYRAAREYLASS